MKTSTETTTPAGLVSRESFLAAIRGRYAELDGASSPYDEGRRHAYGAMECLLEALPSAELPAIGVSDEAVQRACDAFDKTSAYARYGTDDMRAALEAALRPTGEDRG